MSEVNNQIEACLTSDLLEDAKVVWVYLRLCRPNGLGVQALEKRLKGTDVKLALELLEEAGMVISQKMPAGPTYKAKFTVNAKKVDRSDDNDIIEQAMQISRRYNQLREAAIGWSLPLNDTIMSKFELLAKWLMDHGVKFDDYLSFAVKRCGFMTDVPYPTPYILAGNWIKDEYISSASSKTIEKEAAPKHAGKSYYDPAGVREWLEKGGISATTLSKGDLRYVYDYARHIVDDPDTAPEPTSKWAKHIALVVAAIGVQNAATA